MKKTLLSTLLIILSLCVDAKVKIKMLNKLDQPLNNEMLEIPWSNITLRDGAITPSNVVVRDSRGNEIASQVIYEGGEEPLSLIFQATIPGHRREKFTITPGVRSEYKQQAYGRFVPERKDDYAWENNVMGYRAYGPALESETLSSGIDVWSKRTGDMIIDKWYADGDYHHDHGEGCDCYKVGATLGCGASAPYVAGKLYHPRNFASWERLDNGPLRTTVRFTYDVFDAGGIAVKLVKTISLDANARFNKVTDVYTGNFERLQIAAGIAVHKDAALRGGDGYVCLTEPASDPHSDDDGDISCAVISSGMRNLLVGDNLVGIVDVEPGVPSVYYFGTGWSKAGIENIEKWVAIVEAERNRLYKDLTFRK